MQTIHIKAGEKTRIIRKISNSIATEYHFTAQPVNGRGSVSGEIEVAGSSWIFPKAAVSMPLRENNNVAKGMWDTFYNVYVTPDQDVTVSLAGGSVNSKIVYIAVAIGIIAVVAFMVPVFLN